jgi:anaerobic ribonucleoside-triphosphate reductase
MNISYKIEFAEHRCNKCGVFYAVEKGNDWVNCPRCGWRDKRDLIDQIKRMSRRMFGLESAITRMKRRSK